MKEKEEKNTEIYCQIERMKRKSDNSFPVDWNMLPNDIISNLTNEDFDTILSYDKKELSYKTVVYFKTVKCFKKSIIKKVKQNNIVFGI